VKGTTLYSRYEETILQATEDFVMYLWDGICHVTSTFGRRGELLKKWLPRSSGTACKIALRTASRFVTYSSGGRLEGGTKIGYEAYSGILRLCSGMPLSSSCSRPETKTEPAKGKINPEFMSIYRIRLSVVTLRTALYFSTST
jgi:hypothetical protein